MGTHVYGLFGWYLGVSRSGVWIKTPKKKVCLLPPYHMKESKPLNNPKENALNYVKIQDLQPLRLILKNSSRISESP